MYRYLSNTYVLIIKTRISAIKLKIYTPLCRENIGKLIGSVLRNADSFSIPYC